ncbi:MAG: hypothetical protein HQM08_02310 [Candidatus Riflebacteria bacterium]|nr:hypothetical protein [Candidatus Riflebacteria bacterium]
MKSGNLKRGLTVLEVLVTAAIVTFLMGYAWRIYFGGRETMRYTVSQSQIQSESRWFFDHLARDIAGAYRFIEVNSDAKKFSFYAFQSSRRTLEDMFFKTNGNMIQPKDWNIDVTEIEYSFQQDGKIRRKQVPGYLNFIQKPMVFKQGPDAQYAGTSNAQSDGIELHNVADFEVSGYEQTFSRKASSEDVVVNSRKVNGTSPEDAAKTCFIVLRIHTKIDEAGDKKDEDLDLVCKFFSRVRCTDAEYPNSFCTTDEDSLF